MHRWAISFIPIVVSPNGAMLLPQMRLRCWVPLAQLLYSVSGKLILTKMLLIAKVCRFPCGLYFGIKRYLLHQQSILDTVILFDLNILLRILIISYFIILSAWYQIYVIIVAFVTDLWHESIRIIPKKKNIHGSERIKTCHSTSNNSFTSIG